MSRSPRVFPAGVQKPGPATARHHACYQASHRAAREILSQHRRREWTKIRFSKYLNNLIEQDHLSIKLRLGPMIGLKCFRCAAFSIAGIELRYRIRKDQTLESFALKTKQ